MKLRKTAAVLLAALAIGACSDSTGGEPLAPGTYEATLSGAASASAEGAAAFMGGRFAAEGITVLLTDGRVPGQASQMVFFTETRPRPGRHAVGLHGTDAPVRGWFYLFDDGAVNPSTTLRAEEGTLIVDEATPVVVRGRFEITARGEPGTGTMVRASGRFNAVPWAAD